MDDDSPDDVALRTLTRQLFGDHGLGRDTAGERATVRATTADDIREFFAAHYRAGATTVAVAGDVDHDEVVAAVEAAFAGDARPATGASPASAPGADGDRRRDRRRLRAGAPRHRRPLGAARRSRPRGARRRQPRLRRRAVEPAVRRDPRAARPRLQRLLGDVRLRRRRRLVGVRRRDARARRRGRPARRVRARPPRRRAAISDDELEIAIGYLTGAYEMGLEDTGARMSRLGGMLATLGRVIPVDEQLARWEAVTHADVRRVIDRVYGAGPARHRVGRPRLRSLSASSRPVSRRQRGGRADGRDRVRGGRGRPRARARRRRRPRRGRRRRSRG